MPGVIAPEQAARAPVPSAAPLDPAFSAALDRLLLCNQIRELADESAPVPSAQAPRPTSASARLVRRVYATNRSGRSGVLPTARVLLVDAVVLVWLRLRVRRARWTRTLVHALGAALRNLVGRRARYHAQPSSAMTAYVTSTDKEEPLLRACLQLRLMRRYAACIEFLIARLRSGLPATQARHWLSVFLREIGEAGAVEPAERPGAPAVAGPSAEAVSRFRAAGDRARSGLRYGIIIPSMFDWAVFRRSVTSLVESDFRGRIVIVEDGHRPERLTESFCRRLPVTYLKNPEWTGPAPAVSLGIGQLPEQTDVILYAHTDVLWPRTWFEQLDEAWDRVWATGKVGLMNLSFLEFHPWTDPVLSELFAQGRHEDLLKRPAGLYRRYAEHQLALT